MGDCRFWQHNEVIGVNTDVAVAVHLIKELAELGTGERATGIVEVMGVSRMLGNKRDDFIAEGCVIFSFILLLHNYRFLNSGMSSGSVSNGSSSFGIKNSTFLLANAINRNKSAIFFLNGLIVSSSFASSN